MRRRKSSLTRTITMQSKTALFIHLILIEINYLREIECSTKSYHFITKILLNASFFRGETERNPKINQTKGNKIYFL